MSRRFRRPLFTSPSIAGLPFQKSVVPDAPIVSAQTWGLSAVVLWTALAHNDPFLVAVEGQPLTCHDETPLRTDLSLLSREERSSVFVLLQHWSKGDHNRARCPCQESKWVIKWVIVKTIVLRANAWLRAIRRIDECAHRCSTSALLNLVAHVLLYATSHPATTSGANDYGCLYSKKSRAIADEPIA